MNMSMQRKSLDEFLNQLTSKAMVPGEVGAAALVGAIGMALCNKVGNLTVGEKEQTQVDQEILGIIERGNYGIQFTKTLIDNELETKESFARAKSLPNDTTEQVIVKQQALEQSAKDAGAVALEVMRKAYKGILLHQEMSQVGANDSLAGVGSGVAFLKSALISASLELIGNLKYIRDEEYAVKVSEEMNHLLEQGNKLADETLQIVIEKIW